VDYILTPVEELIKQSQEDDLEAFEELISLYQDRVYTHCRHLTGNEHDAWDLAQDVFIQAFNKIKSFRFNADFGTWLHRIAVNMWLNQTRRNRKVLSFSLDEPLNNADGASFLDLMESSDNPMQELERKELKEILNAALSRLHYDYRLVLVLRELEGYSYEDISNLTGWSLGTVKSRINRGRKALRKELSR
jgi:RNA polymerase sigma-70 factor (ECF subfamily)